MLKISRLETKFQEIVFLLTITFALSVFVGGFFYLALTTANFISVAGETGSSMIKSGFNSFGYSYFFYVIFILHMGHLMLGTANYFREVVRSSRVYVKSFAIYFTIILLISSFLTVLENYNSWQASELFAYGYGGYFGTHIGGFLFKSFGLYGSLVILFSLTSVIGISAGYMEIVHSFYVMKDIMGELYVNIKTQGPVVIKDLGNKVIDFIDQKPEYASGNEERIVVKRQRPPRANNNGLPHLHQGGRLMTDHYHIFRQPLGEEVVDNTAVEFKAPTVQTENIVVQRQAKAPIVEDVQKVEVQEPKVEVKKKRGRKKKTETIVEIVEEVKPEAVSDETPQEETQEEVVAVKAFRKRYKKLDTDIK